MENQPIREIITTYLVINGNKPIALSHDEEKVNLLMSTAKTKNITLRKKKITTNKDRIKQIGHNFFNRKLPDIAFNNPLHFRNSIIKEWHDTLDRISDGVKLDSQITWSKLCNKHGIENVSVDEFSTWMLDLTEYTRN